MHGLGNDFVLVDGFEEKLDEAQLGTLAIRLCDRHLGIGADGFLLVLPSRVANFRLRIFNPDGSEPESGGNGLLCFAKYLYERRRTTETTVTAETLGGITTLKLNARGGKVESVRADMGVPRFERKQIPMRGMEGAEVIGERLRVEGTRLEVTCLSIGNPHCATFVDRVETFPVARLGPQIENHQLFPRRTNVEFVEVANASELKVRVWERGAGETLACGSGACAAVIAAVRNGRANRRATVRLPGGELYVEWSGDGRVYMTGPAVEVFQGEI
jgi:diaminopimelate epimerase